MFDDIGDYDDCIIDDAAYALEEARLIRALDAYVIDAYTFALALDALIGAYDLYAREVLFA